MPGTWIRSLLGWPDTSPKRSGVCPLRHIVGAVLDTLRSSDAQAQDKRARGPQGPRLARDHISPASSGKESA